MVLLFVCVRTPHVVKFLVEIDTYFTWGKNRRKTASCVPVEIYICFLGFKPIARQRISEDSSGYIKY